MTRRRPFPQVSLPSRRHWAAWLVVALLWAQGLGVWHHTVHAPGLKRAQADASIDLAADQRAASYSSPLHHAANSADCRLLDQLLLADGLTTPVFAPAVLPLVPALAPCARVAQLALAAPRPYLARAPPALG